jgi:hypothetical protein
VKRLEHGWQRSDGRCQTRERRRCGRALAPSDL